MKKLILMSFLMMLAGLFIESKAQVITPFPQPSTAVLDTVKNTASVTLTLPIRKNKYNKGAIQVVLTELSGTTAGTTVLQYSVDGANFVTSTTVGDTLTHADQATNTKIWPLSNVYYPYYRLKCTGSGTMSGIVKGYFYVKEE